MTQRTRATNSNFLDARKDVLTRLPKGRALVVCEGGRAVVDFTLSPMLERLTYTNQAIAR